MALLTGFSTVANTGLVANTEVYISNSSFVLANTASNGNTFQVTVMGFQATPGEKMGPISYNLKLGANGTITDATLLKVVSSRDVGELSTLGAVFYCTVRANSAGNVAPVLAVSGYEVGTRKDAVAASVVIPLGAAPYMNTNPSSWVLGASFTGGDGVSNAVFTQASVCQIT